jgi:hypothetical protein
VKSRSCFRFLAILFVIPAFVCTMMAEDNTATVSKTGPPKFLNMVHQQLKPGRSGAYDELETSLARIYNRENLPIFWLELESMTGPSEVLYLHFFDSAEEMGKATEALSAGLTADPKLKEMQDRLLQDNISSATSVLAVRRDDLGYRANSMDFSKMRMLHLTTIFGHPGYERAFMQAEWSLSEASERVNAKAAWAVYEVTAGLPEPSFVIVTPMRSLTDVDDALETNQALRKVGGGAVEENLQELGRVAYGASDSQLFSVHQKASHVSREFAAGDPNFWSQATSSPPPSGTVRKEKLHPTGPEAPTPKP